MKRILLLLLIISIGTVHAQDNYIGKSDPEAKPVLKKVTAKYKSFKTFAADFQLTVENSQGQKVSSQKGQLEIKGNKYNILMNGDASFSDGADIYNFDKAANEIQITRVNPKDNTLTPQKLFTDFYEKDYLYKLNDEIRKNGKAIEQVELTPVDKTLPFFKVLLEVDKATSTIIGARVFEKNGTKYIYAITSLKPNISIPDSKFNFNKVSYPGVEVVDLR